METVLTRLSAFPPHPAPNPVLTDVEYDKQAKSLVQSISKLLDTKDLREPIKGSGSLLQVLNPSINSISYLHVLLAHIFTDAEHTIVVDNFAPHSELWRQAIAFLDVFDAVQVRYAGRQMRELIDVTAQQAIANKKPQAAIFPIQSAILRIDPSSSTLTSSHVTYAHLCLLASQHAEALPVLDKPIFHLPQHSTKPGDVRAMADTLAPYLCSAHDSSSNYISAATGLTRPLEYQDYLKYFLYGGMCYMALKEWEQALFFLEVVLTTPTVNIASKIQVEAYKKWILVRLIHRGKSETTLRTVSSQTLKLYQNLSREYSALAEAFVHGILEELDPTRLLAEVQAANTVWQEDFNAGLVQQVIAAYREFSVKRLGNTFAALTIPDVTRRTSPDAEDLAETGQYCIKLISQGKLRATISKPSEEPSSWVLRFVSSSTLDSDSTANSGARTEEQDNDSLLQAMDRVQTLAANIKEASRKFGMSKEYMQELRLLRKGKESAAQHAGGETWQQPPDDAFDDDEDMMAD